jgi:hypothetical protein
MKRAIPTAAEHAERLIDEALEETFPASDSISPAVERSRVNREATEELEANIAAARENLRELIEQAATYSGAADDDLNARRIADQEAQLDILQKRRADLA